MEEIKVILDRLNSEASKFGIEYVFTLDSGIYNLSKILKGFEIKVDLC
jgi:hypothetical protein